MGQRLVRRGRHDQREIGNSEYQARVPRCAEIPQGARFPQAGFTSGCGLEKSAISFAAERLRHASVGVGKPSGILWSSAQWWRDRQLVWCFHTFARSVGRTSSLQPDRDDPYSASTALRVPVRSNKFVSKFALDAKDSFLRKWFQLKREVFTSEAWGSRRGTGKYESEHEGSRLSCKSGFLKEILTPEKSQLVVLVKAQTYLENREGDGSGQFQTNTLTAILCPRCGIRVIRPIPKAARDAVHALSKHDRSFFEPRAYRREGRVGESR